MTGHPDDVGWVDEHAGPFVRPYAVTQGRTRPSTGDFDLIAVVVATQPAGAISHNLQPEQVTILSLCQHPLSVAEVSAHLHLPLGTVRVLLGDLLGAGLILTSGPRPTEQPQPQRQRVLRQGIHGLSAL